MVRVGAGWCRLARAGASWRRLVQVVGAILAQVGAGWARYRSAGIACPQSPTCWELFLLDASFFSSSGFTLLSPFTMKLAPRLDRRSSAFFFFLSSLHVCGIHVG